MNDLVKSMSATNCWYELIDLLVHSGRPQESRGFQTLELLNASSVVDMRFPVVASIERRLGYKFMLAEAIWILSGEQRVSTIAPYNRKIPDFSDDGRIFQGAYGPMVLQQLPYVIESLCKDTGTRQAVMSIWRMNPRPSKDIPCTVAVQWLIRGDRIYCTDTMRSSDIWLGWPYDIFNFSMLTAYICLILREKNINVKPGQIVLNAGSQHLYQKDVEGAKKCLDKLKTLNGILPTWIYGAFELDEFDSPEHLIEHLTHLRDGKYDKVRSSFLLELKEGYGK